jgi:polysaccharide export outer membrane protein
VKTWIVILFCGLILLSGNFVSAEDYRLGPGDILDIGVWTNVGSGISNTADLGVWGYRDDFGLKEIPIRPDGKIAFPLLGDVQASGLTIAELNTVLTKSLAEYIKNPQVTVNLVKMRTIRVYVLGEVNKPGSYEIDKQHNLLDAIGMAGGHTRYAIRRTVYVVHKATGEYQKVNYQNLLTKGDLSQNIPLGDGDVVYLASNGLSFITDILPYIEAYYDIQVASHYH